MKKMWVTISCQRGPTRERSERAGGFSPAAFVVRLSYPDAGPECPPVLSLCKATSMCRAEAMLAYGDEKDSLAKIPPRDYVASAPLTRGYTMLRPYNRRRT